MKTLSIFQFISDHFLNLFGDDTSDLNAAQMMVRAFITFIVALILIRVAGIRSFGRKSAFDIVLSITVGAVLSRCICGHYSYLACISAAAVLSLLHRFIAMLVLYSPLLSKLIQGTPDRIFHAEKIDWKKMRQHCLSRDDLNQALRKAGFDSIDDIGEAYFETDGKLSFIPKSREKNGS